FDGKTLDGWEAPPPMLWSVQDGCITGGDGVKKIPYNDFLCTKASYSNFILHLKIKLTGDPKTGFINSGIQIRTQRNPTGHEVCGYQCDYGEADWYGAIYDEGRRDPARAASLGLERLRDQGRRQTHPGVDQWRAGRGLRRERRRHRQRWNHWNPGPRRRELNGAGQRYLYRRTAGDSGRGDVGKARRRGWAT